MKQLDTISYSDLSTKLSPTALEHFDPRDSYTLFRVHSQALLTSNRFDLGIKTFLAECLLEGREIEFAKDIYKAHLAVWNGLFESTSHKYGSDQYLQKFRDLVLGRSDLNFESIVLPVDQSLSLIDGAHRCSIAAIADQEITIVNSKRTSNSYDFAFFYKCFEEAMPQQARSLTDLMAYYFCKFKRSARCICIMPSTKGEFAEEIETKIKERSRIFYKSTLRFSPRYFDQFILHLYIHDPNGWVGSFADGFYGCVDKAQRCYSPDHDLTVYFVEELSESSARTLKTEIRSLFSLANDSCHVNDSHEETMRLGGFLLNPAASILERVDLSSKFSNLAHCFDILKGFAGETGLSTDRFCIGGSALLALFGKRDCNDFDLILDRGYDQFALPTGLGNHINQMAFYPATAEQMVNDPFYHFHFLGFKFLRPEVILAFKRARSESPKDTKDIIDLMSIFPDLDLASGPKVVEEDINEAARTVVERNLRSQEQTIQRYNKTIRDWYLPELSRLEGKVRNLQAQLDTRARQADSDRQQLALLEQSIARYSKAIIKSRCQ